MTDWSWTDEQLQVLNSEPENRLLVDAGPGTGKTEILCAKVATLIDSCGIQPNEILVLSFTNAAVHELRDRMSAFLEDENSLSGIRISTIDSFGALIRLGFQYGEIQFRGFTEGIELFSKMIRTDQRVKEFLDGYRHVFIDEAQDIVSPRLETILDLISTIPNSTGITIFSDEAQGIYGFAEESEMSVSPGTTLPVAIRKYFPESFTTLKLTKIHRTQDPNLKKLFKQGREVLLRTDELSENQYKEVRDLILDIRHEELSSVSDTIKSTNTEEMSDAFWLFRRRGEALQTASQLASNTNPDENGVQILSPIPHRLRISDFPKLIHPWVAICMWDHSDEEMSSSRFSETAFERLNVRSEQEVDELWKQLWLVAGVSKNHISLLRLANALSRTSPPPFFTQPDYGFEGPVVGTIHSSKGREAESVFLHLPRKGKHDLLDPEEILAEARVLYVGATRAKSELRVSDVAIRPAGSLQSGRAFSKSSSGKSKSASVEIGRTEDIRADGLVGVDYFDTSKDALSAQSQVESMMDCVTLLQGDALPGAPKDSPLYFAYSVRIRDIQNDTLAKNLAFYLSKQVSNELWNVAKALKFTSCRPAGYLRFHSLGVRTLAVAADDEIRDKLHSPWRESGFLLAPAIVGYSNCFFNYYRSKGW
jgi:hypothetical protein